MSRSPSSRLLPVLRRRRAGYGGRLGVDVALLGLPVRLLAVAGTVSTTLPSLRTPGQLQEAQRELHQLLEVER